MDANSIHEYVVFSLVLTGRLLQPRLERLSRCCRSLRGGHGLVQLPVHRSTISLLPVDEPWRAHVYLTFRLTLLKVHEALAKISRSKVQVVDEELAPPVGHVGDVDAVYGSQIRISKDSTDLSLRGLPESNEHETEGGHCLEL